MCTRAQIELALCVPLVEVSYGKEDNIDTLFPVALMERGADAAVSLWESLRGFACHGSGLAGRSTLQVGGNLGTLENLCQLKSLAVCRTWIKTSPWAGQRNLQLGDITGASCPRAACWGRGLWSPLWSLHQGPNRGSLPWLKLQRLLQGFGAD